MTGFLLAIGAVVLVLLAFLALSRWMRPSDERIAQFGPVIESVLRATPVNGSSTQWCLEDRERGVQTTLNLFAQGVFLELQPLDGGVEPDYERALHATWERDPAVPGAPFELEPTDPQRPPSQELIELLGPSVESLRTQPVSSVGVLHPWMSVTVDGAHDGAEAARAAARVYPAVRDMFVRLGQAQVGGATS